MKSTGAKRDGAKQNVVGGAESYLQGPQRAALRPDSAGTLALFANSSGAVFLQEDLSFLWPLSG